MRLRFIAPLAVLAALLVSSVAFGASSSSNVTPVTIKVTLNDYSIKFSKTYVTHGVPVIFKIHNAGGIPHNLDLVGYKKGAIIGSGANTTIKITFKKKATISAICDIPRHVEYGMITTFKVR